MTFKGLIFDFNGVLWWDTDLQEKSWNVFAKTARGRELTDEEMRIHVHGRNMRYTFAYLLGHPVNEAEVTKFTEQKESVYRQMCLDLDEGFQLSPGAIDLLDMLVERDIPHTIATASGWSNVDFFIKHLGLARWFDVTCIVYDDGTHPGKPAPDIYLKAAKRIGLAPAECVVIEDSDSGIAAARAALIGCVVALGPVNDHERLGALPGVGMVVKQVDVVKGLLE